MFHIDKENQKIKQDKENVPKDATCKQVEVRILNKATKGPKKSPKISMIMLKKQVQIKMIMIKPKKK